MGRSIHGIVVELGRGRGGDLGGGGAAGLVRLNVELGRLVGVRIDVRYQLFVGRERGGVAAGRLRDAGASAASDGDGEEVVLEEIRPFAAPYIKSGFIARQFHAVDFELAAGDLFRCSAIVGDLVEMVVAVAFGGEVYGLVIAEPALTAAGRTYPGFVMVFGEDAGLGGCRVEGEDPASFVVLSAGGEDGFGAVGRELDGGSAATAAATTAASTASATVFDLGGGRGELAVVDCFDFTGGDVDYGEMASAQDVADAALTGDFFGVAGIGDPTGDVVILGGGGGFSDDGEDEFAIGRELHLVDGLAGLERVGLAGGEFLGAGFVFEAELFTVADYFEEFGLFLFQEFLAIGALGSCPGGRIGGLPLHHRAATASHGRHPRLQPPHGLLRPPRAQLLLPLRGVYR